MTGKSIKHIVNQLTSAQGQTGEGFTELSPEEAEELAGGLSEIDINGACGNKGCPISNTSCGKS